MAVDPWTGCDEILIGMYRDAVLADGVIVEVSAAEADSLRRCVVGRPENRTVHGSTIPLATRRLLHHGLFCGPNGKSVLALPRGVSVAQDVLSAGKRLRDRRLEDVAKRLERREGRTKARRNPGTCPCRAMMPNMARKKRSQSIDPTELGDEAEALARKLVAAAPGFSDLADMLYLSVYTDDDGLDEEEACGWVGRYVRGSIDEDPRGAVVLLNVTSPALEAIAVEQRRDEDAGVKPTSTVAHLADTILHELGHALWELLDEEAKASWTESQKSHRWGPEEAFADDFMYLATGRTELMNDGALFREVASTG